MKTSSDNLQESQTSLSPKITSEPSNGGTAQLADNRSSTTVQRKLQGTMNKSEENNSNAIQRKIDPEQSRRNNTGLPDNLKSGIENLSGYSMDDVNVHYNSSKPAQLQAHAYAQGTDIHLASGQEKHLAHEAWHVVQQKQGRVKPTRQLKSKVSINDDSGLEKEADVMGAKALQTQTNNHLGELNKENKSSIVQRVESDEYDTYILKLVFAGSGHDYINVDEEDDHKVSEADSEAGFDKDYEIVMQRLPGFIESGVKLEQANIAGPGSPSAPGFGRGHFDRGANKISKLKTHGLAYAIEKIEAELELGKEIKVEIVGHSRGAVAGAYVSEALEKKYANNANVSYIGFDPVPGPAYFTRTKKTDLRRVDSAVVYSAASGSWAVMAPKVLNTRVVILTSAQHSVNQRGAFVLDGLRYDSSGGPYARKLSELAPGVYAEILDGEHLMNEQKNPSDGFAFGQMLIEKLDDDVDTIMERYDALREKKIVWSDFGRRRHIKKAVKKTLGG